MNWGRSSLGHSPSLLQLFLNVLFTHYHSFSPPYAQLSLSSTLCFRRTLWRALIEGFCRFRVQYPVDSREERFVEPRAQRRRSRKELCETHFTDCVVVCCVYFGTIFPVKSVIRFSWHFWIRVQWKKSNTVVTRKIAFGDVSVPFNALQIREERAIIIRRRGRNRTGKFSVAVIFSLALCVWATDLEARTSCK